MVIIGRMELGVNFFIILFRNYLDLKKIVPDYVDTGIFHDNGRGQPLRVRV